jgi:hypothetical protein
MNDTTVNIHADYKGLYTINAIPADNQGGVVGSDTLRIYQQMYSFDVVDKYRVFVGEKDIYSIENILPTYADDRRVSWSIYKIDGTPIRDPNYVSIDSNTGEILPGTLATGDDIIVKATTEDGYYRYNVDTVNVFQKVTGINIYGIDRVAIDYNNQFTAQVLPEKASDKTLTASINNTRIARLEKVDNFNYKIYGIDEGYIKLEFFAQDGSNIKQEKLIEIYKPVYDITSKLSGHIHYLYTNQTKQILTTKKPVNSNTPLAYRVIEGGEFLELNNEFVKGIAEGVAKIEIEAQDVGRHKDTLEIQVIVPVEQIVLTHKDALVAIGEQEQIEIQIIPENATIKKLDITASNNKVSVNSTGMVTALDTGDFTITMVSTDGTNVVSSIDMKVYVPVERYEIKLTGRDKIFIPHPDSTVKYEHQIVTDDSIEIEFKIYPENATFKTMLFEISENEFLTTNHEVLSYGTDKITMVSAERSIDKIKVISTDPKLATDSIVVEFVRWVENFSLDEQRNVVEVFGNLYLAPNIINGITPYNANNRDLVYWSDSESVEINKYGVLTAKDKIGKVNVYSKALDGSNVVESTVVQIVYPNISLYVGGNNKILPINFPEKLIVSTFPENLNYDLTVIEGVADIDSNNIIKSPQVGFVKIMVTSTVHNINISDTIEIQFTNQTFYIPQEVIKLIPYQEFKIDYINFGEEVYWTMDSADNQYPIIDLDDEAYIYSNRIGEVTVYGENESGSKDSVKVIVELKKQVAPTNLLIYPNPSTNNWLNVQIDNMEGDATVEVYDVNGKLWLREVISKNSLRIFLPEEMKTGNYLMKTTDSAGNVSQSWFVYVN